MLFYILIQDDISEIFVQSAAYRNAEPRSLCDLFFYYKRERKRRRQLQKKRKCFKLDVSDTVEEKVSKMEVSANDKANHLHANLNFSNDQDLQPVKFRPFIRSCLLLLVSRLFRVGILFPVRIYKFVT